jgi:hypothetical protein
MNLYFFYKRRNRGTWFDISIEAWEENDNCYMGGDPVSSFTQLERLRIYLCKDPGHYHSARFDHDFSMDSCMGHYAKNLFDFRNSHFEDGYLETDHKSFQRFKKVMIRLVPGLPIG